MIRSASFRQTAVRLIAGTALAFPLAAQAQNLPTGGSVASGSATIATAPRAVTITQSTAQAVLDWTSFNVAAGHSVTFRQPNAASATLNRVSGAAPSTIAGRIAANGAVYLVNPNGIAITSTGVVRTGRGFVASTLPISEADFAAGRLAFTGSGASAAVTNAGSIATTGAGGYVALLGGAVANSGTISVPTGRIALGSGEQLTLDLNGDGFLQVAAPSALADAAVANSGTITASGGRVELRVASAADAVRNVINMTGAISADSAVANGGTILLLGGDGGTTRVTGTLSARATGLRKGDGGFIETSGANLDYVGAKIDTSAVAGKTGTWLIDPVDLTVDAAAAATISTNLATANVEVKTIDTGVTGPGTPSGTNGDIFVNSAITWTSTNRLTLTAFRNIAINAAITGPNGELRLTAGASGTSGTPVANTGAISASGAIDVRLFTLTNGTWSQIGTTLPAFRATDFQLTITAANFVRATGGTGSVADPYVLTDVYGLQGMASSRLLSSSFALGGNIDASGTALWGGGTGFLPIGVTSTGTPVNTNGFTGTLDGRGNTISGLTINRTVSNVGLIGFSSSTTASLSNLVLTAVNISGSTAVGALVGRMIGGTISNVSVAGAVKAGTGGAGGLGGSIGANVDKATSSATITTTGNSVSAVGGLIGAINTAGKTISNSSASGSVLLSGTAASQIGGLIGNVALATTISNSFASGDISGTIALGGLIGNVVGATTISGSFATGNVSGTGTLGGLIGNNSATATRITDSYATGNVTATGSTAGGLIGLSFGGTILRSHAIGTVSGVNTLGGLIGNVSSITGNVTDSYASGNVTGTGNSVGGLVGVWNGTAILRASASGIVRGVSSVGGLIGTGATAGSTVTSSFATKSVTATGGSNAGGLIGNWSGSVTDSYATGSVTGLDRTGGLIGTAFGTTTGSYATGTVTGSGTQVGGLVGLASGTITRSYATGNVSSTSTDLLSQVGGLAGLASANIGDSYATGTVTSAGGRVGGLAGGFQGSLVERSYATGAVTGTERIGGLIGLMGGGISNAVVIDSYASGAVGGTASSFVGGLIGQVTSSAGVVTNTYATGSVTGTASVGGLIGYTVSGTGTAGGVAVNSSYASGRVTGGAGLIGFGDAGQLNNSYWDRYSTGSSVAVGSGTMRQTAVTAVTSDPAGTVSAYSATSYANLTAATGVGTATPGGFVFAAGNSTRPFLAFEVPTAAMVPAVNGRLVITSSHQLQLIGFNAATNAASYVLGNNINLAETGAVVAGTPGSYSGMWSAAGFVPLGTDGAGKVWNGSTYLLLSQIALTAVRGFSGSLNGGGFTLSNLTVARGTARNTGLFGVLSGTASGLTVSGKVAGFNGAGGIAGLLWTGGTVSGSTSSVAVAGNNLVGGLVGNATNGSFVTNSSASGAVIGSGGDIGGLIGYASSATVSGSSASGAASGRELVGGLIGYAWNSTVTNSSATGTATASVDAAGGLIGVLDGGSVTGSTATGTATAPTNAGPLIGQIINGGTVN